jgi:membrane-associated phospholipid phosphatase
MTWDWNWLTPLGHIAVVWPLMIATAALLVARPGGHAAMRGISVWLASMAFASLLVAASKVAFYGWGTGIREWNLTCLSGHSVLAMGFWPVALAVLVPSRFPRGRRAAWIAGALIGLLVGVSRVQLNAHPASEVVAGISVGLLVAAVSLKALAEACLGARQAATAAALIALLCVSNGTHLPNVPTERWLASWGAALSGNDKPVHRDAWISGEAGSGSKE